MVEIAIIRAGPVGITLAEELLATPTSSYAPRCFIGMSQQKSVREIHEIPILLEDENAVENLRIHQVQKVVFPIPSLHDEAKRKIYDRFREFDIENCSSVNPLPCPKRKPMPITGTSWC